MKIDRKITYSITYNMTIFYNIENCYNKNPYYLGIYVDTITLYK